MALPESRTLNLIFKYVDDHVQDYIDLLRDAVAIKSVSCLPHLRDECFKMIKWMHCKLNALGVETEECDIGTQTLPNGRPLRLPPVILGSLRNDSSKPTLCIYCHLDVQPAAREDGWHTEPFRLTEIDGKFYGRGASDDKGSIMCWLNAIQAYQELELPLPLNLKFVFESMEESGSKGLDDLLKKRKESFFHDVDYVCITDNYWLGKNRPCLIYGLRGMCYFFVEVTCANKNLDSGEYGGTINEAMSDMVYLLSRLVDKDGTIIIPNINKDVLPITEDERRQYRDIDFSVLDFKTEVGTHSLLHKEDKIKLLISRWRFPSLSIHGMEGCFSDSGIKTVIPRKVIGKFSIRIVPNQDPNFVEKAVIDYMTKEWMKRGSSNTFKVSMVEGAKPWVTDPKNANYEAAIRATKRVHNREPDMTREGGTLPIALTFQEVTGKSVILLPIGACDDGAHSQNEKFNRKNYIQGIKLLASYLYEIGKMGKT